MIKHEIINKTEGHIIIYANEPIRFEILKGADSGYLVYGYKGTKINKEQEPDFIYDTLQD